MCLYPRVIKNPKYRMNKKNKGNVPHMRDPRTGYVPVGCGMCSECMKQKANNWRVRITEDIKQFTNGKFITLTITDEAFKHASEGITEEGYAMDNEVARILVRRFLERWRKKYRKSVRHWLVTELGGKGTERLHLHGIIWTDDIDEIERIWNSGVVPYGNIGKGRKQRGKIVNYVSARTANYITKYITKVDAVHKTYRPKVFCSPGIGAAYVNTYNAKRNKFKRGETDETYVTENGTKIALPIYLRNKIYTEEEREELWINRLDKSIRYVKGEKISAEDDEKYYDILEYYREKDKELGYGNPQDWRVAEYEHQRRVLRHKKYT